VQQYGYVRINGRYVHNATAPGSPYRGIHLEILNPFNCSTSGNRTFDTHAQSADSDALVSYLSGLPRGTILIAVSFDEAANNLKSDARAVLTGIGANVTGIAYRSKFTLITVIGNPQSALFRMMPDGGDNLFLCAAVTNTTISGTNQ
jgi:Interleukin-like EMT inducer